MGIILKVPSGYTVNDFGELKKSSNDLKVKLTQKKSSSHRVVISQRVENARECNNYKAHIWQISERESTQEKRKREKQEKRAEFKKLRKLKKQL